MFRLRHISRTFSKSFTLLESMIAIIVLSIAMMVVFYAFSVSMRLFSEELSEADVSVETHRAVERMVKELRGSLQIVSGTTASISFWYEDTNGNGTREASETATYTWTGGTIEALNRIVATSNVRVANGIKRFVLTFDNPSDIKLINISITAQKGNTMSTLESSVKCRNL